MVFKVINDLNEIVRQKWSDFVYHHPNGNIFQTPEMYEVYKNTKNYEPIFLAVVNEDNEILGTLSAVIQREYDGIIGDFTARSIVWDGPLAKNDDKKVVKLLLERYEKMVEKKAIYTEFRNLRALSSDYKTIFIQNGYQYIEHLNYVLDLSVGKDKLFSNLSASKRRQIRKARNELNVKIIDTANEKDIGVFYKILSHHYSNYVKKPLAPLDFFFSINRFLVQKRLAKTFVVKHNDKIIGGIVSPISHNFSKSTIYELYICGSRNHDRLYPSVIATWAPIEWGADNGINYFDFMGAGKPSIDYGVREFKSKFGGKMVNYGRFEKIHQPVKFKVAKAGFKLWQKVK